jgi:hypothetical protein
MMTKKERIEKLERENAELKRKLTDLERRLFALEAAKPVVRTPYQPPVSWPGSTAKPLPPLPEYYC